MKHSHAWFMVAMFALTGEAIAQTPPSGMPAMPAMPQPPVASPPPIALPEVSVPTVQAPPAVAVPEPVAPSAATPALPAIAAASSPEDAEVTDEASTTEAPLYDAKGEAFSYGTSNLSLLFTPAQMNRMKTVLSIYEAARRNRSDTAIEVIEDAGPIEEAAPDFLKEPTSYPVFTLKSIAYRDARDWTVWIGDLRITPRTNTQEVRVIGVNRNLAQFLWKPEYHEALQQRANMKLFAPTVAVKHKMTSPNMAVLDAAAGQVTFTLRPNQSFSAGYMSTFEGKITSPNLPKIEGINEEEAMPTDASTNPIAAPAAGDTRATNPDNLDALLKSQQRPVGSTFQRALSK